MSATWRRPKGALAALAIAMTACVALKANEQSATLRGDGGLDGQAAATGGSAGTSSASGLGGGGSAGASGEGGPENPDTGGGGSGGMDEGGDADTGIDDSDASDQPDASDDSSDADDASDGPSPKPCVSTCEREATFGCTATGGVQVCSSSGACLAWRDVGPCPGQHVCCSGVCITDNGLVPPTCSNPTPMGYEFYVDAKASESDAGSLGTRTNPFRTITRALQASARDGATPAVRIYVARGTYDAALGEQFPLILPGGVTLDGAGAARTTIAGLARYSQMSRGTPQEYGLYSTMVMGDKNAPTHVSGFTIVPGDTIPILKSSAVVCDRGVPPVSDAGETGPNTILSDLVVGPGYETGIVLFGTGFGQPSCSMRLRASTILGGRYGITASSADDLSQIPTLEVGDGTPAGGNTFKLQGSDYGAGFSILGSGLRRFDASYNTFALTTQGIYLQSWTPDPIVRARITHNKFDRIDLRAIALWGGSELVVEEFTDNQFLNISLYRGAYYHGDASAIYIHNSSTPGMPFIDHARRNVFYGCDAAIRVSTFGQWSPSWSIADFGSATDPGNNTFHCNGRFAHNGGPGSLYFDFANVPAPVHFDLFQGNRWDTIALDPITLAMNTQTGAWPVGEIFRRSDNLTINTAGATLAMPTTLNDCPTSPISSP